jgi:hypothetical protein
MSVDTVVFDVQHAQYYLADPGVYPDPAMYHDGNGLIATRPGIAVVFSGREWGPIRLRLEIREDAPPLELADWDDVVEVGLASEQGQITVRTMDVEPDLPYLTPFGPDEYRLRVHARNRDAGRSQGATEDPVEEHSVIVWPAPLAPEIAYKHSDAIGGQLRAAH